jgi:hypothetical protein
MSGATVATAKVVAVLLADGWHQVVRGSFSIDTLGYGPGADPGVLGFCFEEADDSSLHRTYAVAGPLNSILAVRQASPRRHPGDPARAATGCRARSSLEAVSL